MSGVTQNPLAEVIVRLADHKYLLGRRFSEWTNRAPALEAAVAAAAMTQDELGHARSLYAALQNLPDSPEAYLKEEQRGRLAGPPELQSPFGHWTEFVAAVALFDCALTLVFEAARAARYEPLRQRAAKILQEEWFHRQYGEGWLRRLSAESRTRTAMQAAVNRFWTPTLEWLDASYSAALIADGVMAASVQNLRGRWMSETIALLTNCGLAPNG